MNVSSGWAGTNARRVFIGYDPREHDAWLVCRDSILAHASIPLCIQPLRMDGLVRAGLYRRSFKVEGPQRYDLVDGKPFSTEFSFSRFLVPSLCQFEGQAMFVDCDFLFRADVAELFDLMKPSMAVHVVQRDYRPPEKQKMDGQAQQVYPRKNWSSLMLFNCGHRNCAGLTPGRVSEERGEWLHQFRWCDTYALGDIPEEWNWLEGWSTNDAENVKAAHFTRGVPSMPGYENVRFADEWRAVLSGCRETQRAVGE